MPKYYISIVIIKIINLTATKESVILMLEVILWKLWIYKILESYKILVFQI